MKEKSTRNLAILIVIVLIIAVLAAIYFFTQKEDVKEQKEEFQTRAEELKRKILSTGALERARSTIKKLTEEICKEKITCFTK